MRLTDRLRKTVDRFVRPQASERAVLFMGAAVA
jgi:hypothetical protein